MVTRILPPREWATRLAGTGLADAVPYLPDGGHVLIVEEAGEIIACWGLLPYWHVEGVWIAPAHRKRAAVARRLLVGMGDAARTVGARVLLTAATSEDVRVIIDKLDGRKLPGEHFVLPVGGR